MGYYGRSTYRGDFYRGARTGDFYRGARGDWLDDLGGFVGKVSGTIDKVASSLPGVGKVFQGYSNAFNNTTHPPLLSPLPTMGGPASPAPTIVLPGGAGRVRLGKGKPGSRPIEVLRQSRDQDREDGIVRRRMNVCNPRALRRALRRSAGFMKFAKHFVKLTDPHKVVHLKNHKFGKKR